MSHAAQFQTPTVNFNVAVSVSAKRQVLIQRQPLTVHSGPAIWRCMYFCGWKSLGNTVFMLYPVYLQQMQALKHLAWMMQATMRPF